MTEMVRVNFARPIPLFPLPGVVLFPHAVQELNVFEPRYCQMVEHCLDNSGQFALASFAGADWKSQYDKLPSLRDVVCVGQIVGHERIADGRHYIAVRGVCRASIEEMVEPNDDRLYRMGRLLPVEQTDEEHPSMEDIRLHLRRMLKGPRLQRMRKVEAMLELFRREDVPTHALLELVGFSLIQGPEKQYRLLAEPNVMRRAEIIREELTDLDRLVALADLQGRERWPKGMSWN